MIQPSRLVRAATLGLGLLLGLSLFVAQGSVARAATDASTANSAGSSIQQRIVQIALSYCCYRYGYAGMNPSTGFDCSGFAWWVYHQAGINFQRSGAANYAGLGQYVSQANLQPGDMILYANTYVQGISHVEIYPGNGLTIGAANPQVGVAVNRLSGSYWQAYYYSARRLVNGVGNSESSPGAPASTSPTSAPHNTSGQQGCHRYYRYYWWRVWRNGQPHTYYRYYWSCR